LPAATVGSSWVSALATSRTRETSGKGNGMLEISRHRQGQADHACP
jgi:hypothetical protein